MGSIGVTAAQEAVWLAQEFAPDRPNNVVTLWDVDGDLDIPMFTSALRTVVTESGALAVNFRRVDDGPRLVVRDLGEWGPFHLDLSDAHDPADAARAVVADLVSRPFDLGEDVLLRIGSIRLGAAHHLVVLVLHHILTDAFGVLTLLSQRIAEVYRALQAGSAIPQSTPTSSGHSKARTALERPKGPGAAAASDADAAYRSSQRFADAERFWRDYLADEPTPAQLPVGVRPAADVAAAPAGYWDTLTEPLGMVTRTAAIPVAEFASWECTAEALKTSVPDLLAAAATAFLGCMCGLASPLHAITVNHRTGAVRRSLGLFSNRVPVKAAIAPTANLAELAADLGRERLAVLRHARHELALIKRATGRAADERSPFGAIVNVIPFVEALDLAGSTARFAGGTFGAVDEVMICARLCSTSSRLAWHWT